MSKYQNSCSKFNLTDFKTQKEDNIPQCLGILIQTYRQSLFIEEIGKLKDTKTKLYLSELIPPVAQAERCIPFSLGESVHAEIRNLEEQIIIEYVTSEATPRLS